MKPTRKVLQIPIHDVTLVIIITDDIPTAYKREFDVVIDGTQMACLGYDNRKFALFFEPHAVERHEVIAHEVFHLTHRILENNHMHFDENHHEMGAYLCEYLTKRVFEILK